MSSPKIFVVDDSEIQLILLRKVLSHEGYRVKSFLDGERLLSVLENERPDLVISDIDMPVMNGFKLISKVRKQLSPERIPCLLISSKTDADIQERALLTGADQFVGKPLEAHSFIDVVKNLFHEKGINHPKRY